MGSGLPGDAMASFLDSPDELTKGKCLMAKADVDQGPMRWNLRRAKRILSFFMREPNTPNIQPLPVTYYAPFRRRWFASASNRRWCVTGGFIVGALIMAIALLIKAMRV